jgi:peptide/nickel transport system substrate-binding protein
VNFRRALSLGIDREQMNEAVFLGTGTPGSIAPPDGTKFFLGKEWRTKWATFDVAQANQLLDKTGLTRKDAEGYRLRKDGKGRLRLPYLAVTGRAPDSPALAEMLKQQWVKIGIELTIENASVALAFQRVAANSAVLIANTIGCDDPFLDVNTMIPQPGGFLQIMGVPYGAWIRSGGKQGKEPFAELKQLAELIAKGTAEDEKERIETGKEVFRRHIDNVFTIGVVSSSVVFGGVRLAKTNLGNVPARVVNSDSVGSPLNAFGQTFYYK